MTEKKPAFTVLTTSSADFAPLMTAKDARYAAADKINDGTNLRTDYVPAVWIGATRRLLASSCAIFARIPVLPAKAFCKVPIRTWPIGADTRNP
jgi:hypothetical protein